MKKRLEKSRLFSLVSQAASLSPAFFAYCASGGKYRIPKHIELLSETLSKVAKGDIKRLIVSMPPRHGKSELISKYFPAWYLGSFPERRIILSSYEAGFAAIWGGKARELVENYGFETFGIEVSKTKKSAEHWEIENHSGAMYSVGAGGAITGKGADLLIIDDPVKNDSDANSPTYREKIWEWFLSTAYTRLEPNGAIIIVMTRWREDDLVGKILKESKEEWTYLKLSAIAEDDDILKREIGEALWEERFSINELTRIKEALGSYWFSALYQQTPSPSGGGIFKRENFRYFDEKGEFYICSDDSSKYWRKDSCGIFMTADLATSLKESADYTAVIVFAASRDCDILILECVRIKIEGAEHLNLITSIYNKWKPCSIGIEAVQYQSALLQSAIKSGLPAKKLIADKDKLSRSLPIAAKMEAGKVFFKRGEAWLGELENELVHFPKGERDDQIDALAYSNQIIPSFSDLMPIGRKARK